MILVVDDGRVGALTLLDLSAHLLCFRLHLYSSQQWRHAKKSSGFEFWSCVVYAWPWCICPTKFCANSSIQFGVIDIFRNQRQRPPPSWIFKSCTFGTFRHVNSVVLELYIKFGSNICDSHWDQHTYAHLMTSRELNFWFQILVRWSSPHGRGASSHKIWCRYMYPVQSYCNFFSKLKMAAAAILDFQFMWIWPFRRVDSVVFVFCTKFGSNICYSRRDRRTYASDLHLMTSRELTSGFDFWSRGHLHVAMVHLPI